MHQSGSVSLCRSAISVLVATALYSPIALASTVEYGETVDGVVLWICPYISRHLLSLNPLLA
ncbi:hypothetical protein, partial [Escherichia coli]|uniref:hypothetical protein n=1 Tax=Escherichia coli TaxID=562 RepID=UPI00050BC899